MRLLFALLVCLTAASASLAAQEAATALDERALVELLHDRITAPDELTAYTLKIPGSEVSFRMVPIAGGEFQMGSPESETGRGEDEGPQHAVRLDPFWMSEHEVTWDEYRLFMLRNSSLRSDGDELADAVTSPTPPYVEMSFGMGINGFPAISMTQHAASKYAQWLSARTGRFFRLPTEAEWEYACRAGASGAYSFGDDPAALDKYAWHRGDAEGTYHEAGKLEPNAWGLYDMHGNVWEWTLDELRPSYEAAAGEPAANPWAKATELFPRVVRGGSWMDPAPRARCAARRGSDLSWKMQDPQLPQSIWYHTDALDVGFRLVEPLKTPSADEMYDYWNSAEGLEE